DLDNGLFQLAGTLGVFTYKRVYRDGVLQPQAPNGAESGNQVLTSVGWYTIGDAQFVTAPGEVFPFTYEHSFGGPAQDAVAEKAADPAWVVAHMNARWRFIEGLGEDMLGYIFPR